MKKAVGILFVSMMILGSAQAQDVTTVQAMSSDISDHLDLEAVAAVFAESENLEDFEKRLNDPESRLSNLDMNEDGYVDYLRVVENSVENARMITIQAVVGRDIYQDVATIDVEVDERGQTRVQVVGDVYMYGPDYIIEPVYRYRPRIFVYLWAPRINPWCSTFSWGYYPSYWSYWAPYSYYNYYSHIHSHHYYGYTSFYYRSYRRSSACAAVYYRTARQDYAHHHPYRSFTARNDGYRNKRALETSRPASYYTAANTKGTTANTKDIANANSRPASQWNNATASNQKPAANTQNVRSDKGGNTVANTKVVRNDKGGNTAVSQRPVDNSRPQVQQDWTKPSASSSRDESVNHASASATRPSATNTSRPSSTQRPQAEAPRQQPSTRPQAQSTSRPSSTERPIEMSRPSSSSRDSGSQARPSSSSSRGIASQPSRSSSTNSGSQARPSSSSSRGTASQPSRSGSSSRSSAGSSSSSSRGSSSAPSRSSSSSSSKKR